MSVKKACCAAQLLGIAMLATFVPADVRGQQTPVQQTAAPAIDDDDIGGVVTSRFGPEAGVWVIAETTGLGTRFAKMAVTDERGRYVIPDLPKASYRVWVRGYGLVDSPKLASEPGKILDLTAVTAPSLAEAAPNCLLCYEADWQVCHRRRVAEIMAERRGFGICHLGTIA